MSKVWTLNHWQPDYFTADHHRNKVFDQDLETLPIVEILTIFPKVAKVVSNESHIQGTRMQLGFIDKKAEGIFNYIC